jgi:virulence-associated protein VagC
MSTTITAKVFKAGNSKALRLPRGLDVKAKS